jgi:hypothetical protein
MDGQAEQKLKDYVFRLIEAHAHNQEVREEVRVLRDRTAQNGLDALALQRRKERM